MAFTDLTAVRGELRTAVVSSNGKRRSRMLRSLNFHDVDAGFVLFSGATQT